MVAAMRRQRHAKIVATLGPATSSEATIAALVEAGADVFRLNFSHGTHAEHADRFRLIRDLEGRFGRPIGVLADLQGPKLRVGRFAAGKVMLATGQRFRLDLSSEPGDAERAPLPHPEIFQALAPGEALLLDDGRIRLRVLSGDAAHAETEVIVGGPLSDNKGVNVPDSALRLSALTDKDRTDLAFALELGVPWVALSFVQTPADIDEAQALLAGRARLIAKIEKPSAVRYATEIIERTDAVMVARGDLGVEMPPEDVPMIQKRLVRACRVAGRPVIVATQMLDSMIQAPTPTRAEASDVATAVNEGADAVMLSAETAIGQYAPASVAMMDRIIRRVEGDALHRAIVDAVMVQPEASTEGAITHAARQVAETAGAVLILTYSASGATTLRAARERPPVPILALTPDADVARRLALVHGVQARAVPACEDIQKMVGDAVARAVAEGFAEPGERIVITAGVPLRQAGNTNLLYIVDVPADGAPTARL